MLKLKLHCSVFIRLMATAVSVKTTILIVAIDEAAQLDAHCWCKRPECDTSTPSPASSTELRWSVGIISIHAKGNSRRLECLI